MTEQEYREHVLTLQELMYGIAVKAGLPGDDAADAVQETLLRLWRRRQTIPSDPAEVRRYSLTAMRNACLEWYRRRRGDIPLEEAAEPPDPQPPRAEFEDTRQKLELLIETLPEGQRIAVRLSGLAGLETAEIAQATGQTEGNVRQLLSRGRKKLKELWTRYEN